MEDAALLMDLNNDPETAQYVVGNPRQVTLQEQIQWMERTKTETDTHRFIVEHSGAPVGTVIISSIDRANLTANVNIKLHRDARGKGIGKQSIMQALQYCFETLGLFCVTAHVLSYNTASLALFNSCGFVNEGILRSRVIKNHERCDLVSFSKTRNDP
jgi:diamine N-acetyltransferase